MKSALGGVDFRAPRVTKDDLYLAITHFRTVRSKRNRDKVDSVALALFSEGLLSAEELRMIIA